MAKQAEVTAWLRPSKTQDMSLHISLRDWFAGQALIGILTSLSGATWDADAENAYKAADAMIKARNALGGEA